MEEFEQAGQAMRLLLRYTQALDHANGADSCLQPPPLPGAGSFAAGSF
jgi:hypothetical protein